FGKGTFEPEVSESTRVYGLAGETLLNFGPIAVPFAFVPWGLVVACLRRAATGWQPRDARFLLYPLLVAFALCMLFQDVDNLLFFLIKNGTVPLLVVWFALQRSEVRSQKSAASSLTSDF